MKQGFFITIFLFSLVSLNCSSLTTQSLVSPMEACPKDFKEIALSPQLWQTEYSGYGHVEFSPSINEILMSPKPARSPQSTHASLVLSKFSLPNDFELIVEYKNNQALRSVNPNTWEVFWLFFQYRKEQDGTKSTNYVIAKPNGMELGKAYGEVEQVYVKTVDSPKATFNQWHQLRIKKHQQALKVLFDQQQAFDTNMQDLFTHEGFIGLYSEDASVTIRKFCIR